jgi:hypothetical protein
MTPLAAISVGSILPATGFDAVVSGVFDHACNIRLADGRLATCTTVDYFDMPRGIRVDTVQSFRFASALRGHTSAHCRGGVLRFEASALKIDLRRASTWTGKFTPKTRPPARLLQDMWRTALADDRFALAFRCTLGRHLAELPGHLIGRGPGLTPAGDDLLAGRLAAPMLLAPGGQSSHTLCWQTRKHLSATNEISAQMLDDATHGLFIEPVISLMSALYSNGSIEQAARNLRAVGATSGPAMLLGVLAGIGHIENFDLQLRT